ncbi:unnamed protein product [Paramecium pentaurelia]|uniref:dipeptidyl-peptidase III n=1 Tax=Paramecium pentaurelia TaxID=43138 RepID=A0A8S1SDG2_9CILI|nr:unnamed protein product [Paramecium pentaurelia]
MYENSYCLWRFQIFLNGVAINLRQAQNQNFGEYIKHFESGDIEQYKESQKLWIQDKGPIIETNIGFIQTYLDPMKVSAEYERFVSIVKQEELKLLVNLVEKAENIIKDLPWLKVFEIKKFSRPDFTSLEILSFACFGTPVGINILKYDDIRQNLGLKNVNLGNVQQQTQIEILLDCYKEQILTYQQSIIKNLYLLQLHFMN